MGALYVALVENRQESGSSAARILVISARGIASCSATCQVILHLWVGVSPGKCKLILSKKGKSKIYSLIWWYTLINIRQTSWSQRSNHVLSKKSKYIVHTSAWKTDFDPGCWQAKSFVLTCLVRYKSDFLAAQMLCRKATLHHIDDTWNDQLNWDKGGYSLAFRFPT